METKLINVFTKKTLLLVALFCFFFTGYVHAADWYTVRVVGMTPRTDSGDVVIQVTAAGNESRFSGVARGLLPGTEPGTNKIMAVLLTSITLGTNVSIEMADVPASWPPQVITGCGLLAPAP